MIYCVHCTVSGRHRREVLYTLVHAKHTRFGVVVKSCIRALGGLTPGCVCFGFMVWQLVCECDGLNNITRIIFFYYKIYQLIVLTFHSFNFSSSQYVSLLFSFFSRTFQF